MCKIIRTFFFYIILLSLLLFDGTLQSHVRWTMATAKVLGNTIKSPLLKTIGNTIKNPIIKTFDKTIKNSMNMFSMKKNNMKYVASGLDKLGEEYLRTRHSVGNKFVKNLGIGVIDKIKDKVPYVARIVNKLVTTRDKKNI